MKKWLSILMVAALMMSMVMPCLAEGASAVPSKTTTNTSQVVGVETATGNTFAVEVTEDAEPVKQEIAKLYSFVNDPNAQNVAPIDYFDAAVQQEVLKQLVAIGMPENYDMKQLELNEFVTIKESGYEESYGDVVVKIKFVTEYKVGQKLAGVIGFYDDSNAVTWQVVPMEVLENGMVAVTLNQQQMLHFRESAAVALTVLSEPMAAN